MKARTTLLLTLGVLGCCGAASAQTDSLPPPPPPAEHGIAPYDVVAMVRSMDLAPVTAPIRRGTRYVVNAIDRWGNTVRVVVDGQVARIIAMRPLRSVMREDDDDDQVYVPQWDAVQRPPAQAEVAPLPPDASLRDAPHVIYADPQRHAAPTLPPPHLPRVSRINPAVPTVKPLAVRPRQPPLPRVRPPADEQVSLHPEVTVKPAAKPPAKSEDKVEGENTATKATLSPSEAAPSEPTVAAPTTPPAAASTPKAKGPDFPPVQPPF